MELGLITFADMEPETSGRGMNGRQRIKDLLEEIQLADQLGLDVFGVGEHHRPDYAVSSPAIILAAAAVLTQTPLREHDRWHDSTAMQGVHQSACST